MIYFAEIGKCPLNMVYNRVRNSEKGLDNNHTMICNIELSKKITLGSMIHG